VVGHTVVDIEVDTVVVGTAAAGREAVGTVADKVVVDREADTEDMGLDTAEAGADTEADTEVDMEADMEVDRRAADTGVEVAENKQVAHNLGKKAAGIPPRKGEVHRS
jgi:hypothetical protein